MRGIGFGLIGCAAVLLTACGGGGGGGSDLPAVEPNVSWVRDASGTGLFSEGTRVDARGPNNVITAVAHYPELITLGAGTPTQTSLTCDGEYNAAVARYDDEGNLVWARKIGSVGQMFAEGVLTLNDGSCLVTGWFSGSAVFAEGLANETVLLPVSTWDGFLAKYSANGSFLWVRHIGPGGQGVRMAVLTDGTVGITFITWSESLTLNLGQPDAITFDGLVMNEGAVAKYTTDGQVLWAERTQSTGYTTSWGIDALPGGGMVVASQYQGDTIFGKDGQAADVSLSSLNGSVDTAVVAYGPNGNVLWARSVGGSQSDYGQELATSANGMVYVTGTYQEATTAGAESGAPQVLNAPGNFEATFLASYDAAGTFRWLRGAESPSSNRPRGITVFPDGAVGIAGGFTGDLVLGLGGPTMTTLSATLWDGYVARYAPSGLLDWAVQVSDEHFGEAFAASALTDNSLIVTGAYAGVGTWGAGDPNETTLSSVTPQAFYIARYNPDGGF